MTDIVRLIDKPTVLAQLGLSVAQLHRLVFKRHFPSAVRVSPNEILWNADEVSAALRQLDQDQAPSRFVRLSSPLPTRVKIARLRRAR